MTPDAWEAKPVVVAAVAAVGLGTAVALALNRRREIGGWKRVGTVEDLRVYPMKGCKAKPVLEATFEPLGIRAAVFRDRTFGFIKESGATAHSKEFPLLSQLDIVYRDGRLTLIAPDDHSGGLVIEPQDLMPDPAREIAIRLYDVDVRVVLVGAKYDEYITRAVSGESETQALPLKLSKTRS